MALTAIACYQNTMNCPTVLGPRLWAYLLFHVLPRRIDATFPTQLANALCQERSEFEQRGSGWPGENRLLPQREPALAHRGELLRSRNRTSAPASATRAP